MHAYGVAKFDCMSAVGQILYRSVTTKYVAFCEKF